MFTFHHAVTVFLVHCSIGGLIWVILDGLGVIQNTFTPGKSGTAVVIATLIMVLGWPLFVWRWLKGMAA